MSLLVEWHPGATSDLAASWLSAAPDDRTLLTESADSAERELEEAGESIGRPLAGHPLETYAQLRVMPRVPEYRRGSLRVVVVGAVFVIVWASPADRLVVVYAAGRKRFQIDEP